MTLRIGVHPNNLHLTLAERWTGAFDGLDVTFVGYQEGRDSGRLLAENTIDLCGTGSTPPILAQAMGLDVHYVAASAPRPTNGALVTAPSSPIRRIEDLRGCRIALLDGSFHTYFLARALEDVGLRLAAVRRVELMPAASLAALAAGEVDAWIAMAPHLDQAVTAEKVRVLLSCGDTIPNRSVFWTLRRRGFSPPTLNAVVTALQRLGEAIAAEPARAASLLTPTGAVDAAAWRRAIEGRDWRIFGADTDIQAEQQLEFDTLTRHGALVSS